MKVERIRTDRNINELIRFLLPDRSVDKFIGISSQQAGRVHAARTVIELLWDGGSCPSVGALALYEEIKKRDEWNESDEYQTDDTRRDRLRQVVRRINDAIQTSSRWRYLVRIKGNRLDHTYRLVLDPKLIKKTLKPFSDVDISMMTSLQHRNMPMLRTDEIIKFKFSSSVAGYLHIFHIDADNLAEMMFPQEGASRTSVKQDTAIEYPTECFLKGYGFTLGRVPGSKPRMHRIAVVVTGRKVQVNPEHLAVFGIAIRTRGAVEFVRPEFSELKTSELAFGEVRYYALPKNA